MPLIQKQVNKARQGKVQCSFEDGMLQNPYFVSSKNTVAPAHLENLELSDENTTLCVTRDGVVDVYEHDREIFSIHTFTIAGQQRLFLNSPHAVFLDTDLKVMKSDTTGSELFPWLLPYNGATSVAQKDSALYMMYTDNSSGAYKPVLGCYGGYYCTTEDRNEVLPQYEVIKCYYRNEEPPDSPYQCYGRFFINVSGDDQPVKNITVDSFATMGLLSFVKCNDEFSWNGTEYTTSNSFLPVRAKTSGEKEKFSITAVTAATGTLTNQHLYLSFDTTPRTAQSPRISILDITLTTGQTLVQVISAINTAFVAAVVAPGSSEKISDYWSSDWVTNAVTIVFTSTNERVCEASFIDYAAPTLAIRLRRITVGRPNQCYSAPVASSTQQYSPPDIDAVNNCTSIVFDNRTRRFYAWGNPQDTSALYISEINTASTWLYQNTIHMNTAGKITRVVPRLYSLVVLTETAWFRFQGYSEEDWQLHELDITLRPTISSIINHERGIFCITDSGVVLVPDSQLTDQDLQREAKPVVSLSNNRVANPYRDYKNGACWTTGDDCYFTCEGYTLIYDTASNAFRKHTGYTITDSANFLASQVYKTSSTTIGTFQGACDSISNVVTSIKGVCRFGPFYIDGLDDTAIITRVALPFISSDVRFTGSIRVLTDGILPRIIDTPSIALNANEQPRTILFEVHRPAILTTIEVSIDSTTDIKLLPLVVEWTKGAPVLVSQPPLYKDDLLWSDEL